MIVYIETYQTINIYHKHFNHFRHVKQDYGKIQSTIP